MSLQDSITSPYFKTFHISGIHAPSPSLPHLEMMPDTLATVTLYPHQVLTTASNCYKIYVDGCIALRFQYVDTSSYSKVHCASYDHFFSTYIEADKLVCNNPLTLHTFVQDIYSTCLITHQIYYSVLLIIVATLPSKKGGSIYA